MSLRIPIRGADYQPKFRDLKTAAKHIADKGDLSFDSGGWPDERIVWTDGSTFADYIPPLTGGKRHVLPANASLTVLRACREWECPSADKFDAVRQIIEATSNMGVITQPGYERLNHLAGLHLGGHQPANTPHPDTRIEWWRDNWSSNLGGNPKKGWYFGTLPGRSANGWDNNHYNRLLWETGAMCFETDHEKRQGAWAFYLQQAVSYEGFGRIQSGPKKGYSRTEKGDVYVGRDSGGNDVTAYEKDWVPNLVGSALLTEQELFTEALVEAADFYSAITYQWGGAWGARIPGRILENMLQLWMVLPTHRWALEREMGQVLDLLLHQLDKSEWFWLNLGNRGKGPMSGWMHSEAVASILRVHEHIPSLRDRGPSRADCVKIMQRVMDTTSGIEGGSEMINGYACLRYRFHTNTGESMNAVFAVNTAFALPALRLLQVEMPTEYENCKEFVQRFAGSSIADVRADTPVPLDQIGYRFPREGPAWTKTILEWIEGVR